MITDEVIREIYQKYSKPPRKREDLRIDYFLDLLKAHHHLRREDGEIIVEDMEETNPFSRFLERALHAIIEFDKMVAFVLRGHILFFEKKGDGVHVHFKPVEKKGFFDRLFGKD